MKTKKLEKNFIGIGDVKGFKFTQIKASTTAYLYEVNHGGGVIYFDVFKRKTTPVCIDFKKRVYSETEQKEIYPKTKDFGIWAWNSKSYFEAIERFIKIQ